MESEVREWIRDIGMVISKGATITPNEIDDKVIAMFFQAVDSELVWKYLWPLIDGMFTDDTKVMASAEFDEAAAVAMINPMTILAIIKAMKALWDLFKKN